MFTLLNEQLKLLLGISIGIFLFVLFFQPFPLYRFDFNNKLLFVAGLGAIVFLFMVLVRIVLSLIINNDESVIPAYLTGFIILVMSSVAFAFYLRYVGGVSISFYIMFKVVLICLAAPVTLRIFDTNLELRQQNELLIQERKTVQRQVEKCEEDYLNKSIEFVGENNVESLSLLIVDVVFIKSADNYVEIVYKEDDIFKRKLIRNTLKNIEHLIRPYTNFIRCHRICIVNMHYIEKLNKSYNNHWLTIKGYEERIPVSRQYLLKIKEAI